MTTIIGYHTATELSSGKYGGPRCNLGPIRCHPEPIRCHPERSEGLRVTVRFAQDDSPLCMTARFFTAFPTTTVDGDLTQNESLPKDLLEGLVVS
jgi:hypothetical protein